MHRSAFIFALFSLGSLSVVADARAAPAEASSGESHEAQPPAPRERRAYVGITGGFVWATVEHPEIRESSFTAATLGLHAGYRVIPSLSVGLEMAVFEKYMRRLDDDPRFAPESSLEPQNICQNCSDAASAPGGKLMALSVSFLTVGPRVEFTPFGEDGLYVGAFAGVATVLGVPGPAGFGGAARIGFRLRPLSMLSFAIEGGVHAQGFEGGSSIAPHAQLVLRPYF